MPTMDNDQHENADSALSTAPCSHTWETVARMNEGYDSETRISWCSECGAISSDLCFDGREREQWIKIPSANAKDNHG